MYIYLYIYCAHMYTPVSTHTILYNEVKKIFKIKLKSKPTST